MAKVFNIPLEFDSKLPKLNFTDMKAYWAEQNAFIEDLRQWCIKRNPQEYVGDTISFPVADGKAVYMVAALKPVHLIHLPLGDAWNFEYAHRLTAKDIKDQVNREKRLKELFAQKQK